MNTPNYPDICNQDVIREFGFEKSCLSTKVIHLLGGRDSTVTDFLFLIMRRIPTHNVLYILKIISSLSGWSSKSTYFTFFIPDSKSFRGNLKEFFCFFSVNIFIFHKR